jgi:hypothetical protein
MDIKEQIARKVFAQFCVQHMATTEEEFVIVKMVGKDPNATSPSLNVRYQHVQIMVAVLKANVIATEDGRVLFAIKVIYGNIYQSMYQKLIIVLIQPIVKIQHVLVMVAAFRVNAFVKRDGKEKIVVWNRSLIFLLALSLDKCTL